MKGGLRFFSILLATMLLAGYVCAAEADGFIYPGDDRVVISHSQNVNVRAGGGTEFSVIATALSGSTYRCIGQTASGWYVVELETGAVGCIAPSVCEFYSAGDASGVDMARYTGTASYQIGKVRVSESMGGYIDMFTRRDESQQFLRHVFNGEYICVGEAQGYYMILVSGYLGYVRTEDVVFTENRVGVYTPDAIGCVWIETADMVNVRTGPSQYTELAMCVCPGACFLCVGVDASSGWYQILLPNGTMGYISPKIGTLSELGNG